MAGDGAPGSATANLISEQGANVAELTPEMCLLAALTVWPHRDPFDRMLAATASILGLPLVSMDGEFDRLGQYNRPIRRIW